MMKKSLKTMAGVTLLEIMLVLAIAAMVIVLSIKYYQSAASSSQANAIMGQLQSFTAAADNLAQASGTYNSSDVTNGLSAVLPASAYTSPWGETLTFTPSTGSFEIDVPKTPTAVCALVKPKFLADSHTKTSQCDPGGTLKYIYVANP